jgi:uncharacterized protein
VNNNHLYFHSAKEGKKIDIIRKNNQVCFEMDVEGEIVKGQKACFWGMKYVSVIGFGQAFFIEDNIGKRKALDILMKKYASSPPPCRLDIIFDLEMVLLDIPVLVMIYKF